MNKKKKIKSQIKQESPTPYKNEDKSNFWSQKRLETGWGGLEESRTDRRETKPIPTLPHCHT